MLILLNEIVYRLRMEKNIACAVKMIPWIRIGVDANVSFVNK